MDQHTRTIHVRADVENSRRLLRASMFGEAEILVGQARSALSVPTEAVQWEGSWCWLRRCCWSSMGLELTDVFITLTPRDQWKRADTQTELVGKIAEATQTLPGMRGLMSQGVPKREAIEQARLMRVRPVLMTGLVACLGFVPMAFSTGVGAEVQRPLATAVVFGVAADTFLTMLVLPAMYLLFGWAKAGGGRKGSGRNQRTAGGFVIAAVAFA